MEELRQLLFEVREMLKTIQEEYFQGYTTSSKSVIEDGLQTKDGVDVIYIEHPKGLTSVHVEYKQGIFTNRVIKISK